MFRCFAQVTAERKTLELEAERLGYIKCHRALKPWLGAYAKRGFLLGFHLGFQWY
jgi:hypothetical protein